MTLKDYSFYLSRYSSCHRLRAKVRQTCSFSLTSAYYLSTIWSNRLNFALLSRQSAASLLLALTHRRKIRIKRNPGSSFFLNYILSAILNYSIRLFGNILNIPCSHFQISMTEKPLNREWISWSGGNRLFHPVSIGCSIRWPQVQLEPGGMTQLKPWLTTLLWFVWSGVQAVDVLTHGRMRSS